MVIYRKAKRFQAADTFSFEVELRSDVPVCWYSLPALIPSVSVQTLWLMHHWKGSAHSSCGQLGSAPAALIKTTFNRLPEGRQLLVLRSGLRWLSGNRPVLCCAPNGWSERRLAEQAVAPAAATVQRKLPYYVNTAFSTLTSSESVGSLQGAMHIKSLKMAV